MPDTERFDRIEARLDSVENSVGELRGEVGELRGEVGELRGEVGELRGDVHTLRVIVELHDEKIQRIAEVQSHHGKQLEQIQEALKPLAEIHDFIHRVAHDHERRITALEARDQ